MVQICFLFELYFPLSGIIIAQYLSTLGSSDNILAPANASYKVKPRSVVQKIDIFQSLLPGGGVLGTFMGGGVHLGLWNSYPKPDHVQLHFPTLF